MKCPECQVPDHDTCPMRNGICSCCIATMCQMFDDGQLGPTSKYEGDKHANARKNP